MKYNSPNSVVCLLEIPITCEGYLSFHNLRLRQALGYLLTLEIQGSPLKEDDLYQIRQFITATMNIVPTDRSIRQMFQLYPFEASVIIGDPMATDAREAILHMVSHFYLNSWWPSTPREADDTDDGVTETEWIAAIQKSFVMRNEAPF